MSLYGRVRAAGVSDAVSAAVTKPGLAMDPGRLCEIKNEVKQSVLDRVGYSEAARIASGADVSRARDELRPAVEAVLNARVSVNLSDDERQVVMSEVLDDVVGLGPLQPLLEDDAITEVMVNGCAAAFVERAGKIEPLGSLFESDEQIRIAIDRIISPLGRRVDERSPMVNARLVNGYRVNAVIPPIAIDGPALTIRKFSERISS